MNGIDIILLMLILGYCSFVVYRNVKKKGSCTHVCSTCSSTSCHLDEYTKELRRIREEKK